MSNEMISEICFQRTLKELKLTNCRRLVSSVKGNQLAIVHSHIQQLSPESVGRSITLSLDS